MAKTSAPTRSRKKADRNPGNTRGPERDMLKQPFLAAFKETGTILKAAEAVGIDRNTVYQWLKIDKDFAQQYILANEDITEMCETAALKRAVSGVTRLVIGKNGPMLDPRRVNEPGGPHYLTEQEYSDHLLQTILMARNPAKYGKPGAADIKIDLRIVHQLTTDVAQVLQKRIPTECPHCHTLLDLMPAIVEDLNRLSQKFEQVGS